MLSFKNCKYMYFDIFLFACVCVVPNFTFAISDIGHFDIYRLSNISLCSAPLWMELLHEEFPCLSMFVDVGSNKGYTSQAFFNQFAPRYLVGSGSEWYKNLINHGHLHRNKNSCGSCRDCCETDSNHNINARDVCPEKDIFVWAFEPDSHNYDILKIMQNQNEHLKTFWRIENMAISNRSGYSSFTSGAGEASHINGIDSYLSDSPGAIPIITLDDYFDNNSNKKIGKLDILKIDAEGYDWTVILGAQKSIKKLKVKFLIFEWGLGSDPRNGITPPLKNVIAFLNTMYFSCYMAGLGGLIALTGEAWYDEYDIFNQKSWFHYFGKVGANIFCVSRIYATELVKRYENVAVGGKNIHSFSYFQNLSESNMKSIAHLQKKELCTFPLPGPKRAVTKVVYQVSRKYE